MVASAIPYSIRTYQRKVRPNLTSWSLWTLIGLALLLTYKSSGADANVWPAVFGFTNPLLIAFLVFKRHGGWTRPNKFEVVCIVLCLLALSLWFPVRDDEEMAQWALYLAIIADMFAGFPTMVFVWKHPDGDRPLAWAFFAVGYGLGIFAITEHTFANYILPIWMFVGAMVITIPLALYRWRRKIPLSEWV